MSKQMLCVVHDKVAEAYLRPFCARSRPEGKRIFESQVIKGEMAEHGADFDLYCVGTFDERAGRIEVSEPMELLAKGSSYMTEYVSKKEGG